MLDSYFVFFSGGRGWLVNHLSRYWYFALICMFVVLFVIICFWVLALLHFFPFFINKSLYLSIFIYFFVSFVLYVVFSYLCDRLLCYLPAFAFPQLLRYIFFVFFFLVVWVFFYWFFLFLFRYLVKIPPSWLEKYYFLLIFFCWCCSLRVYIIVGWHLLFFFVLLC